MKKFLLSLVVLGALAVAGAYFYIQNYQTKKVLNETEVVIEIEQGDSLYTAAKKLRNTGVISEPRLFVKVGQFFGYQNQIKFGEYRIYPGETLGNVFDKIINGKTMQYKVVLTEGSHIYDLAYAIEKAGLGSKNEFLALIKDKSFVQSLLNESIESLEGYLFPDTYYFSKTDRPQTIIKTMVDRFFEVFNKLPSRNVNLNRHEIVTLASIIEKETGAGFEREIISSVFHNRLKKGMRLATDPTIIYGVLRDTGVEIKNIKRKHLQEMNPYNTYKIAGLPPGPIGNPGKEALKAAVAPKSTPFLFFVSKNDGTHVFSANYEDHQKAVRKFQLDPRMRKGKSWRDLNKKKN